MLSRIVITVAAAFLVVGSSPSQSLAQLCSVTPQVADVVTARGKLLVKENLPGREKLKLVLKGLWKLRDENPFGDPVTGTTSYAMCIYDDADTLVAQMEVDQAQQDCGTPPKPCWRAVSYKRGYRYRDKDTTADGIERIIMKSYRPEGDIRARLYSSGVIVSGKNDAAKGWNSLPTGIAAALENNTKALIQVVISDGDVLELGALKVTKADGLQFKGFWP